MNRQGYIKIMAALINLLVTIMVEAGKVPYQTAVKVGQNVMKAVTGGTGENKQ
jgi:hypothetical protein